MIRLEDLPFSAFFGDRPTKGPIACHNHSILLYVGVVKLVPVTLFFVQVIALFSLFYLLLSALLYDA